jgi:recombination protein RecA
VVVEEIRSRKKAADPAPKVESESDKLMAQISKVHGPNVMRRAVTAGQWRHIPLDVFTLDMAQFGGLPRSALSMYYGWEAGGKTTLGLRGLASAQRMFPDMRAAIIDAEGTYDPVWGKSHGIDNERLLLVHPETGEQALDIANALIRSADVSMLMVDSLPALVPAKEMEKSLEDDIVAMQARLIGRFIRTANAGLLDERKRDHTPVVLLINQWRSKIAFMGDTRSLPGGNALKFFVFNRVEILNKEVMGKDAYDVEIPIHNDHSFKMTKNKEGTGIRNGAFTMIRDPGHRLGPGFIDDAETVLAFAKKFGIFTGAGKYQKFDDLGETFGTMKEAAEYFYNDFDYYDRMKKRLISLQREHSGLDPNNWL